MLLRFIGVHHFTRGVKLNCSGLTTVFFFPCIGYYSAFFSYFMALNLLKRSVVLEIARLTEQLLSILNNHFKSFL